MRTNSRRVAHAPILVVLTAAAAVSLSGRVEAQQSGLFPLAPIRRQRVPCSQEDPTYKIYKQQYFGYHPTCWRTFPPGWGAPSAQAPDAKKSFQEMPAGKDREEEEGEAGMAPREDDQGAPPARRAPAIPNLPRERDPFEPDRPAGGVPGAAPLPGRDNAAPGPGTQRRNSPFEDLNRPGASLAPSRGRSRSRGASPSTDDAAPELAAPAGPPAQGTASRSRRDDDNATTVDGGPLLGLADSDIVRSDGSSADETAVDVASTGPASAGPATNSAPSQQPRRRLFGNLFSGIGSSWLRR